MWKYKYWATNLFKNKILLLFEFPLFHLLENNGNLIGNISKKSTAENHDKDGEKPGLIRLGCNVAVADGDHGYDGPVVADQVLGLPGGERIVVKTLECRQPGGLTK